jgi:hypothetical protein
MSYWDEVKDIVYKGVNMAVDNLKEGANTAAEKSRHGVAYVQLKKDLFFEQRKLQAFLADLGNLTHILYKENKDIYADDKIKEVMKNVIEAEKVCKDIEDKIAKLSKEEKKGTAQ